MTEDELPWITDCYINANPPHLNLDWSLSQATYGHNRSKPQTIEELIEDMDRNHIDRGLLAPPPESAMGDQELGYRWTLEAVQKHPDRFALSVRVHAEEGIRAVRHLEGMVRNDGARALRIVPYRDGKKASHRSYFPVYSKCIELGIPVTITTGMPLVQRRGIVQDPKHLDKVCAFFPELVIVSAHGGAPWTSTLVQLLKTWPNLYHMISAYAPSRYPPEIGRLCQLQKRVQKGAVRQRLPTHALRENATRASGLRDQRRGHAVVHREKRGTGYLGRRDRRRR